MTSLATGQRLGAYRIVRLLGEGGMGAVYEARQEPLDRRVALKTLHADHARNQEAVARFFNEAKVLSRLEHPSIVQVSDFGQSEDGLSYLVMEFLSGQSLGRRLGELKARGERMAVVSSLQLAWQVADVLAVAHAQGIIHRDLKPDNLMLVPDPVAPGGERVKILDFGIAKLTRPEDRGAVKTDTQAVMGTPLYMSPEQCAGAGGVDAKTDVYSLGCVVYEALAGRPPFIAEGAGQLIGMHLFQQPLPILNVAPKVPTNVAELLHRLLTKDKAARPNMSDAADEIGRLLAKLSGAGPVVRSRIASPGTGDATQIALPNNASTLGNSIGQSTQRRKRGRVLLAAGALVAMAAGVVAFTQARTGSQRGNGSDTVRPPGGKESSGAVRAIRWQIETEPAGAQVFDDKDTLLGVTPLGLERAASAGQMLLRVARDGYQEEGFLLERGRDDKAHVELKRIAASVGIGSQRAKRDSARLSKSAPPTVGPAGSSGTSTPATNMPSPAPPKKTGKIGYED